MHNEGLFQKRLKKAQRIATLLSVVPFVRMIGLNGSMVKGTMREDSDIDFLIISSHGRIWTVRFLVTILTHITGQRRYGDKVAGRICLNRYQSEHFLGIEPHNEYHAETFSSLVPLYDDNIYKSYQQSNVWMQEFDLEVKPGLKMKNRKIKIFGFFKRIGEFFLLGHIGNIFEKLLRKYQSKRILNDKRTHEIQKGRVRVSDWELCFHPKK